MIGNMMPTAIAMAKTSPIVLMCCILLCGLNLLAEGLEAQHEAAPTPIQG